MNSSPTLSTAAERITQRLRELAERPAMPLTLRELIDRRMAVYAGRDTSIGPRLATWQQLLGDFALETLNRDVIWAAREELKALPALAFKGVDHEGRAILKATRHRVKTPATINRYMAALSGVCTWAIEQQLAPRGWANPCRGIKRMKGERERLWFLDADERERLFASCMESNYPRMHALVLTAMLTGGRLGELMSLTWRQVDLRAGVARLGRTKNGDRRTLVLVPQVVDALKPFASSDADRYVFGSVRSRYTRPADIGSAWKAAVARAKIERHPEFGAFRFHDLRHCFASYLAQAGKPLQVIKESLGHRKLDMTLRYAHLTVTAKAEAIHDALKDIGK